MTSYLKSLVEKSFGKLRRSRRSAQHRRPPARRNPTFESLETRELLAVVALQDLSVSENTGEKPQSKVWEHAGQWYSVVPSSGGTSIYRLDGTSWTQELQLSGNNNIHADVKVDGDVTHILLFDDSSSQLASVEYAGGRYQLWSERPSLVNINLGGVETATLDIDSTGRMWVAGDDSGSVHVWYADGVYSSWSAPVTIATGIKSDDICAVTALPDGTIGVLWSDQSDDRFGFRVHVDGASPTEWSANEVPAGQSALNVGSGMADDHLNVAVGSDGTLYAAVKTSYDSSGYAKIGLLVRRPWGTWDDLYTVDTSGTRPIVVLNELQRQLIVAYPSSTGGGSIVYRTTSIDDISFSARKTLISGTLNDPTSTKQVFDDEVVILASSGSKAKGVLFSFEPILVINQPPAVEAGADQSVDLGVAAVLNGIVSDDGYPATPGTVVTTWSQVSGPGTATFADASAASTTVEFSEPGEYVLLLTADDGDASSADQVTITVVDNTNPGDGTSTMSEPVTTSFQDGLFPLVAYAGTTDTQLASNAPTTNYGNATTLSVDGATDTGAVVEWDVSYIPTGSVVTSAQIELYVTTATTVQVQVETTTTSRRGRGKYSTTTTTTTTTTPVDYNVYALEQAWDEISATWDEYAANLVWGAAGASGTTDYDATLLAQASPTASGTYTIALNDAGLEAVQSWIDDPSTNFGLILQDYSGSSGGFTFNSSEASTASLRPKLTVTYLPASSSTPTNEAPTVDAGTNQNIQLPGTAALNGTVTDDGLPTGNVTTTWTKVSGPGTVAFNDASAVDTTASFSQAGTYVLRLTADDGSLQSSDTVTLTVLAIPVNVAPVVNAGSDLTIQLSDTATLNGTVTDDGLPTGNVTTTWTQVSGPGTVTFGDASAVDTTASFSEAGTYVLRLLAHDGELNDSDDVTIVVDLTTTPTNTSSGRRGKGR